MKVLVDLCIIPIGTDTSISEYISACEKVLSDAGLKLHLHAYGTNIEGEWDTVFAAIKRCHQVVHKMGAPRLSTSIRIDSRTDQMHTIEHQIKSVKDKLDQPIHFV